MYRNNIPAHFQDAIDISRFIQRSIFTNLITISFSVYRNSSRITTVCYPNIVAYLNGNIRSASCIEIVKRTLKILWIICMACINQARQSALVIPESVRYPELNNFRVGFKYFFKVFSCKFRTFTAFVPIKNSCQNDFS